MNQVDQAGNVTAGGDQAVFNAKMQKIATAEAEFNRVVGIVPAAMQEASPEYQAALKNLQNANDEFDIWKNIKLMPDFFRGKKAGQSPSAPASEPDFIPKPNPSRKEQLEDADRQGDKPKPKKVGQNYGG